MKHADHRLIQRLKKLDEHAFEELVGIYQREVFGVVLRLIGDREDARDVTQEVFISVFKSIHSFRGDASLRTWILHIARNQARSRLRFRKSRNMNAHQTMDSTDPTKFSAFNRHPQPDERAAAEELASIARTSFLELSADAREVLTLRDLNGLSYDEIATIVDVPRGTVRSRLFRARKEWRMTIEQYRSEPTTQSPDDSNA